MSPVVPALAGKRVIVTGSAGHLGRAVCQAVGAAGGTAVGFGSAALSLLSPLSMRAALAIDGFDGVVNCAGRLGAIGPYHKAIASSAAHDAIDTNLSGVLWLCGEIVRVALENNRPCSTVLIGGGGGASLPGLTAYAVAKAALSRLAECLADEYGAGDPPLRFNVVAPGPMAGKMRDQILAAKDAVGRELWLQHWDATDNAERAAACVTWLLSDDAGHVNGRTVSAVWDPWPFEKPLQAEQYKLRRTT